MSADDNKAPGSDGFTLKFAQKFWADLREELTSLLNLFF